MNSCGGAAPDHRCRAAGVTCRWGRIPELHRQTIYVDSRQAVARPEFSRVGLTDSVLLQLMQPSDVLLTADHTLVEFAASAGHEVVNFRYLPRL